MTISRESPVAIQAAAKAITAVRHELEAVRGREGDEVALGHASGALMAVTNFLALDLNQPHLARSTINEALRRLDITLPIKPAAPPPRGETWELIVAHNAENLTANLWEAQRLLGGPASLALVDATVRATLRFLVETYQDDHARELAEGLRSEVDQMVTGRNATITSPRQ